MRKIFAISVLAAGLLIGVPCGSWAQGIIRPKVTGGHKPSPKPRAVQRKAAAKPDFSVEWKKLYYSFVYVRGGTFMMGATEQMANPFDDEKPVHEVTVDGFFISKYEVTQALWESVMHTNPSHFKGANLPVEGVTKADCLEFIARLNALAQAKSGNPNLYFRLPTEAEWEYAARGGEKSQGYQYSGGNDLDAVAWYDGNSGFCTHPVGRKRPNELGLYDMTGNVWEWCSDGHIPYTSAPQTNPIGPLKDDNLVMRGGSWQKDARWCRISMRTMTSTGDRSFTFGLRLVMHE